MKVICQYCSGYATLVTGKTIYPHRADLGHKKFWRCEDCDAYVGCHPNTSRPLGRLANKELRYWKKRAHDAFDILWRSKGGMTRGQAYLFLQQIMNLTPDEAHIGEFDVDQCKTLVSILSKRKMYHAQT